MRRSPAPNSRRSFKNRANKTALLNRKDPRRGGIRL